MRSAKERGRILEAAETASNSHAAGLHRACGTFARPQAASDLGVQRRYFRSSEALGKNAGPPPRMDDLRLIHCAPDACVPLSVLHFPGRGIPRQVLIPDAMIFLRPAHRDVAANHRTEVPRSIAVPMYT